MKIIDQFRKLKNGSKMLLKFSSHPIEIYCGVGSLDYGIIIPISLSSPVNKRYEKFNITTIKGKNDGHVILIQALLENLDELELFSSLSEYVLFEIDQRKKLTAQNIKTYVDTWLNFSRGKKCEISISKQIGLIGEIMILEELIKEFPLSNQLNNWQGPEGSKIDFIFSNTFGLEVKSRIQPFKDWIRITSAEQLDNDMNGQHMVICDFLPNDKGLTLKDVASNVIAVLNDQDEVNRFIRKLLNAKYDYFEAYTDLVKVSAFRRHAYDTKSYGFPYLPKPDDIRVDKIYYEINISGLDSFDFTESLATIRNQQELN
jgi:hypothetical protein